MRLLVTGSRTWEDSAKMAKELTALTKGTAPEDIILIEGCAKGADQMAEGFAKEWGWANTHFPADWKRYGKGAGPMRNRQMLLAGPDIAIAFHKGDSPGTKHMIQLLQQAGVPCRVVK